MKRAYLTLLLIAFHLPSLAFASYFFCSPYTQAMLLELGKRQLQGTSQIVPKLKPDILEPNALGGFEGRQFATTTIKQNPKFWRARGFALRADGKLVAMQWSDINRQTDHLEALGDPDAPAFRFYEDASESGISRLEFARRFAKGEVPIARADMIEKIDNSAEKYDARLKEHDRLLHGPAYLLVPKKARDAAMKKMAALVELLDSFPSDRYPKFHKAVESAIHTHVGVIDEQTSFLMSGLAPDPGLEKHERSAQVSRIARALDFMGGNNSSPKTMLGFEVTYSEELKPVEKVFLNQLFAKVDKELVPRSELDRMANRIYDTVGPYATAN